MPDPVNGAVQDPPAPPAGDGANPPAPPAVPFDKDVALQDYINRQVENRLNETLSRIQAAQPAPANPGDGKDPLDAIAEELAAEEKLDPAYAKSIVGKFKRIVEHTTRDLRGDLTQNKLIGKFSQVFSKYEDAQELSPAMTKTFKELTELERNFVLNAPDGAEWLYQKVRSQSSRAALPPSVRAAAGAAPSRAASPESKVGSMASAFAKANELMRKGDRAGYEEAMAQINRG